MAESPDQSKPFAPSSAFQPRSDDVESAFATAKSFNSGGRNCIKICGCITASFLLLAVAFLVLSLTVFHIKHPAIKMDSIILSPLKLNNGTQSTTNQTFAAVVSVKNPNAGAFKYSNGTTRVFYGGEVIGEGVFPAGEAAAKRTVQLNVTVNLMTEKMSGISSVSMNSSTVFGGKVKILKTVKKYWRVEVNCSVVYYLQSQQSQHDCHSHFI